MSNDWDVQDTQGIAAIYVQPASDGVEACVSFEMVGGQKRYARFWPRHPERIEWGWRLHESAVRIWPPNIPDTEETIEP